MAFAATAVTPALASFDQNLQSVHRLMGFDSHVLEFVDQNLEALNGD